MADWQTVRFDPEYEEPLDPEIIPLCDVPNAAGFVTTSSCAGHGSWPHVWFEHSTDERIESLARFIIAPERQDCRRFFSLWQKEIRLVGYAWCIELHLNNVYASTPFADMMAEAAYAAEDVARRVREWMEQPK